jgi:uncharacterized membrane protein
MYVDLGAKRLIIAERSEQKIAVEVKSFLGLSEMQSFCDAVGQFAIYRAVLRRTYPDFILYLAIRDVIYTSFFEEPIGQILIEDENLKLIIFDAEKEEILQWKS